MEQNKELNLCLKKIKQNPKKKKLKLNPYTPLKTGAEKRKVFLTPASK